MPDLTWEVKKIEDSCGVINPSWIIVNPIAGTSADIIGVSAITTSNPNDCSNGYVTIVCNETGDKTVIPVSRCVPKCDCDEMGFVPQTKPVDEPYEASGETVTLCTWTGSCGTDLIQCNVGGTILSNVATGSTSITAVVKKNETNQERNDFFRVSYNGKNCCGGEIFQLPYVSPCFDSETVSLEPLSVGDIPCSGDSFEYTINGADCWEILGNVVINPPDMASVYPIQKKIIVTENGYEPRNGTCDFTLVNLANGHTSAFTMTINQEPCERPATCTDIEWVNTSTTCTTCDCNKNDFVLLESEVTVSGSGVNSQTIGEVNGCIGDIHYNDVWEGACSAFTDGNILKLNVDPNPDDDERTAQIEFTYFDRCGNKLGSSGLKLIQEEASSCIDLEITSQSVTFNSDGSSEIVGTISGNHNIDKTGDTPSWITVSTSSGNVYLSANASTVLREGTVTFKVDNDICNGQTVAVKQTVPVSIIKYYSPSQVNVNLNDFTPAATAETFSNGIGKIEFADVVTEIKEKAFSGKTAMTGIDIPNSITAIGNSAFTNCTSLTSITIPSGVESINNYLLYNCTSLSSVTLESETLQLKPYSISNCPNLRKIEMTSVTACPSDYQNALENSADCPIYVPEEHLSDFWNSSTFQYKDRVIAHIGNNCVVYKASQKLTGDSLENAYSSEYKIYSAKLSISLHTFNSSTKIGKITYDGVVRSFHDGAFDTRAIDYIVLPENIKRIGQTVFESSNLISIYFPDSLVGLCNSATDWGCDILHNCRYLKKVVAGSGLTQIGYSCFSCADETSSLTGITFYSTTPPTLDHESTFGHTIHASIYVPCGRVSTYKSANIWNDSDIKGKIKAIPPCTS